MTIHLKVSRFPLVILSILFLISSCNNSGDEKKADDMPASNSSNVDSTADNNQPQPDLIGGTLDKLLTDSTSFLKLDTLKLVLVFTFRKLDTLTLHGWSAKKDSIFKTPPDIKLTKGPADTIRYGNDMYFGNVVIKKKHVKQIMKVIRRERANHIIFDPVIIDGNHIGYDILVSREDPRIVKEFLAIPTGAIANPSPPKTY